MHQYPALYFKYVIKNVNAVQKGSTPRECCDARIHYKPPDWLLRHVGFFSAIKKQIFRLFTPPFLGDVTVTPA